MSTHTPIARKEWFTRTFRFDLEPWMMPNVVERLRGTPARLEDRLAHVARDVRTRAQQDGRWTLQQNAGHLLDLEALWFTRLQETLSGTAALTAADVTNKKTHDAKHDERAIEEILRCFREERGRYVAALEKLGAEDVVRAGFHPRLETPMRIIDQAFFVAEHDDHHLARIAEMLRSTADRRL